MDELTLPMLLGAAVAGAAVGFLSGVFGLGGGFMIVPVLNIVLRVPMPYAVGAGACQVLGPATTALLARRLERRHLRLPLTIAGGLLVGVFLGAWLLHEARRHDTEGTVEIAGRVLPLADLLVLVVYFLLLTAVGLFALFEAGRSRGPRRAGDGWLTGWRVPPYAGFDELGGRNISLTILAWFGLGVGFLSGLLGMSGGLILLPGLVYLVGMRTHQAILSSLVIVWIVAVQSTLAHAWHEHIDLRLVASLLVGGTIGARLGSEFGRQLAGWQLRVRFAWLLLATATLVAARLAWMVLA